METLGKSVHMTFFVDANHYDSIFTWIFYTDALIYVMNAPIIWFSKKQNNVERSMFGYEFVAMRTARDLIVAIH